MTNYYADDYEDITGKSREEELPVGSVSIIDMAETKEINADSNTVSEEPSPEVTA